MSIFKTAYEEFWVLRTRPLRTAYGLKPTEYCVPKLGGGAVITHANKCNRQGPFIQSANAIAKADFNL